MKKIIFVPILLFIAFLIVLYLLVPSYSALSSLEKQVQDRQNELAEKQVYFARIEEISKKLEDYKDFLEKVENALPQEISVASLLNFFQQKSSSSGLTIENISPREISNVKEDENLKIKETGFSVIVNGPYTSFLSLLQLFEKSSRIVEVETISINPGREEGKSLFEFSLLLKVYSYK